MKMCENVENQVFTVSLQYIQHTGPENVKIGKYRVRIWYDKLYL